MKAQTAGASEDRKAVRSASRMIRPYASLEGVVKTAMSKGLKACVRAWSRVRQGWVRSALRIEMRLGSVQPEPWLEVRLRLEWPVLPADSGSLW